MGLTADIAPTSIGRTGDEILEARDVVVRFGGLLALDRVNIALRRNEIFGLIGPNGAGKSTTVNVLTGFQQLTSGEVLIDGKSIAGWSTHRVARSGVARTFQAARLFPALSVFENVAVASVNAGGAPAISSPGSAARTVSRVRHRPSITVTKDASPSLVRWRSRQNSSCSTSRPRV
jgi:ABC-type branched-subunit amino acid transport system ATPase component